MRGNTSRHLEKQKEQKHKPHDLKEQFERLGLEKKRQPFLQLFKNTLGPAASWTGLDSNRRGRRWFSEAGQGRTAYTFRLHPAPRIPHKS